MSRLHGFAVAFCAGLCLAGQAAAQSLGSSPWPRSHASPARLDGGIQALDSSEDSMGIRPLRSDFAARDGSAVRDASNRIEQTSYTIGEFAPEATASTSRPVAVYSEDYESPQAIIAQARSRSGEISGTDGFRYADANRKAEVTPNWSDEPETQPTSAPNYLETPDPTPVERDDHAWDRGDYLLPEQDARSSRRMRPSDPWIEMAHAQGIATWLPGSGNDLGLGELDIAARLAIPKVEGMWIRPGFGTVFTHGPVRTDLPPRLYNARLEVGYKHEFARYMGVEASIAPGIYSDFERGSSDAIRILGRGVGYFAFSERTQAILGIAYLDRDDVRVLPIFGIVHAPNANWRLELVFPQPKLAYRILQADTGSGWVYMAGEFGGSTWAIRRASGIDDVVTYSDWRLKFGFEMKMESGRNLLVETGYVFNRKLQYRSGVGDYDPNGTAMFRFGCTY